MSTFIIRIEQGSQYADVNIEPEGSTGVLPNAFQERRGRWFMTYPLDPHFWRTARAGWVFKDIGNDRFRLQDGDHDTAGVLAVLLGFGLPPTFGATGPATIQRGMAPNAKWEMLAGPQDVEQIKKDLAEAEKEVNEMYQQMALDVLGFVDPTPLTDCASAGLAAKSGDYAGACLSLLGILPILGDLAGKSIKGSRFAVRLSGLFEKMERLKRALRLLQDRLRLVREAAAMKLKQMNRKLIQHILAETGSKFGWVCKRAGMEAEHLANWRLFCGHSRPPKLMIMRARSEDALRWARRPDCAPKPVWVKLKTAKEGPHQGLVVYPKSPKPKDIEDIAGLKKMGYRFEPDAPGGVLISPQGKKYYSDFDKMGVYDCPPGQVPRPWKGQLDNDNPEMQGFINKNIYGGEPLDRHGGQDFLKGAYEDVGQHWERGRMPDAGEVFLVVGPDGIPKVVDLANLPGVYQQYRITYPYAVH